MKTAAIYARVSTEEQVKNTSLKGQLDACRQHAIAQGYVVIKEISEDFSGARLDRPGLDELRGMAERSEIQALVVYEPDRLSRKVGHLLLLEEELARYNASLLFVSGQDDTTSPEGRMFFTMRGAFGEFERTKIIERMRLGKSRLAKSGKIIGNNFVPLGYSLADGEYHIIEEEARLVRQIFDWVVYERLSLYQVGVRLTAQGAVTKRGNTRWLPAQVKSILDNETYAGTYHWNKSEAVAPKKRHTNMSERQRKVVKTSRKLRDRSEWVAVPCPAIVSKETFDAAHKQLQLNSQRSPRNTRRSYLLRGLMKCRICGYRYVGRGSSAHQYYFCGGKNAVQPYRYNFTGKLCPSKNLRADRIEQRVWGYIEAQVTDEENLTKAFERVGKAREEDARRVQGELESIYAAEARLDVERNKMLDLYSNDIITVEQLQERLDGIRKKLEAATQTKAEVLAKMDRFKTATATTEALREYSRKVKRVIERAGSDAEKFQTRRTLLEMLETEIEIDKTHIYISGIITGKLPISEAEETEDNEEGPSSNGCLLRKDHAPLQVRRAYRPLVRDVEPAAWRHTHN